MAVLSDKPTKHQMPEKRAFNKAIRERHSVRAASRAPFFGMVCVSFPATRPHNRLPAKGNVFLYLSSQRLHHAATSKYFYACPPALGFLISLARQEPKFNHPPEANA